MHIENPPLESLASLVIASLGIGYLVGCDMLNENFRRLRIRGEGEQAEWIVPIQCMIQREKEHCGHLIEGAVSSFTTQAVLWGRGKGRDRMWISVLHLL